MLYDILKGVVSIGFDDYLLYRAQQNENKEMHSLAEELLPIVS